MTPTNASTAYQPPVAHLLTYGDCRKTQSKPWPNYVTKLGLEAEHVPELLRMMSDRTLWEADSESLEVWATIHAWRSLAQLQAIEMIEPLLNLFSEYEGDDWLNSEAPLVFAQLGITALPKLKDAIANSSYSEWARCAIAEGLERLATKKPEHREVCVQVLAEQLEAYAANGEVLNGSLVAALVELKAIETAGLIEQVYQSGKIDDGFAGTWARVQVDLGLKQKSDFSEKDFQHKFFRNLQAARLIRNPDYYEPNPFFDRRDRSRSSSAPLEFGKGELKIPKKSNLKSSTGFSQARSQKSKKK